MATPAMEKVLISTNNEEDNNSNKDNTDSEPSVKKAKRQTSNVNNITSSFTSQSIADSAQSVIGEMEMKRKNDEALVSEFRKMMEMHTDSMCNTLHQSFGKLYETTNGTCQQKLQKLYDVLGRISQLEQELFSFRESLKLLYSEVETTS